MLTAYPLVHHHPQTTKSPGLARAHERVAEIRRSIRPRRAHPRRFPDSTRVRIAALVRLAGDVSCSVQRGPVVTTTGVLRRYKTRWTAVAESHSQRWRAGVVYGSAA